MLKTLIVAFIVAAFASLAPALAQMPAANPPVTSESDQAAPLAQPEKPKAAYKKHNKKHAAKRAKAKTETENPDTEKKEGDTKQSGRVGRGRDRCVSPRRLGPRAKFTRAADVTLIRSTFAELPLFLLAALRLN